jgi:peptide/nickel transport system substrate-binding protein/oligopeptide transport system substrate-binding protein
MVQQTATATQQQSQTSRKIGEQAVTVRDYTKHLKRAMSEQKSDSRAISRAMENIMGLVQDVLEASSVLATESAAIVKSMNVISQSTRESNVSIADLNQMTNTLSHESNLLNQELERFDLPEPSDGGSLTVSTVLWQQLTMDPPRTNSSALGYISKSVHANLVFFGEGAELVPGLAERWEVLAQGHVYRFHLRHGARFHNGRLVEAKDVHDSLARLLYPETKSHATWILRGVKGSEGVLSGKTRTLDGIRVRDAHTVDIVLDEPLAFFISLLTMHETAIIPIEETHDEERFRIQPVGAGPFKVEEARDGEYVRLRRHRDYFIAGKPHIDQLTFRLDLHSFREVTDAFLRGELDAAHGVPPALARELEKDPAYGPYLSQAVQLHTSYLGYDCSSPPFDRLEVRQALNHAVNRDRINERIFAGAHLPTKGILPPGLLGYDPSLRGYDHDPERARALLRQAGYGSGFTVEYRTWDSDEFHNNGTVPLIIEDLEAVGIRTTVTRHSAAEARRPLLDRGHGLIFTGNWYADFPDSDNFFYIFFHSAAAAIRGFHYNSPEIDRKVLEARHSNDSEQRAEIYRGLDQMVVKEAILAPLFHDRFFLLTKPNVRGLRTSLVPPPVRYVEVWMERE